MSVRNPRGARRLTTAASEALIDVRVNVRIIDAKRPLHERSHEENPSPGGVILVAEGEVRGACLQTKAAVHAGHDPGDRGRERRVRECARWSHRGSHCGNDSPSTPGL